MSAATAATASRRSPEGGVSIGGKGAGHPIRLPGEAA